MEANLKDDLEADSLDAVELIMQIEEEFEVEIPDEVASNMKTVKDMLFLTKNISFFYRKGILNKSLSFL